MGKFAKGCLITAGVFIAIGLIIGIIVTVIGGRSFWSMAREYETSQGRNLMNDWGWDWGWNWGWSWDGHFDNDLTVNDEVMSSRFLEDTISDNGIDELEISIGVCELVMEEWDEEDFGIEISGRGDCEYYVADGCLYVEGFDDVDGDPTDNEIYLSIPQGITYEDINISVGAARAEISGVTTDSLTCSVGMGKVDFTDIYADTVNMDAGMGAIDFEGRVEKELAATCGMGNFEVTLEGSEEEYNYTLNCAAGKISVDGDTYSMLAGEKTIHNGADREIRLDCGMGSMDIEFTE